MFVIRSFSYLCRQFNLISFYAQNLKLFHSFFFKSLVTNYINKIGIDLVIFGLLFDVGGETFISFYRFFYQFSRKVPFSGFFSANHQKRFNFLFFAWNMYCCIIVFEVKNPRPWRPRQKSIPYPLPLYIIHKQW